MATQNSEEATLFREYTREMNSQERTVLKDRLAEISFPKAMPALGTVKWIACWGAGLGLCAFLAFVIAISGLPLVARAIALSIVGVGVMVCLYAVVALAEGFVHWRRRFRDAQQNEPPAINEALASGKVFVKKVVSSSVVTIEPFEDEGAGHIFDIGDGRLVFLKGDQYFPARDGMSWPNSDFEIVRSADKRVWLGVFCYGSKLEPAQVIDGRTYREDVLWRDCEDVVEATMHDFLERITIELKEGQNRKR